MGPDAAASSVALQLEEMGDIMPPRKKSNDFERGHTPTGTPEYSVKFYDTRKPSEQSLELQESGSWKNGPHCLHEYSQIRLMDHRIMVQFGYWLRL